MQRPGDQFRKHDVPAERFSASEVEKAKAAAIETVFCNLRGAADGLDDRTCYDFAMRALKAGRAGSWEAALLEQIGILRRPEP